MIASKKTNSTRAMYQGVVPGQVVSAIFDKDASGVPHIVFGFSPTVPGNIKPGDSFVSERTLCLTDEDDKRVLREIAKATGWTPTLIGDKFDPKKLNPVMLKFRYRPANEKYSERCDLEDVFPASTSAEDQDLLGSILAEEVNPAGNDALAAALAEDAAKNKEAEGKEGKEAEEGDGTSDTKKAAKKAK